MSFKYCTLKLKCIKLDHFGWMISSAATNLTVTQPSFIPTSLYPKDTTSSPAFACSPSENITIWKHFRFCFILMPLYTLFYVYGRHPFFPLPNSDLSFNDELRVNFSVTSEHPMPLIMMLDWLFYIINCLVPSR